MPVHRAQTVPKGRGIHVFLGGTNGLPAVPSQTLRKRAGRFDLAFVVASAGDVNGDGCQDLAVTAADSTSQIDQGLTLIVLHGSKQGLEPGPACFAHSEQAGSAFASAFSSAGDVNHDGYGDLLVGAMKFNGRYHWGGKAYLLLGSANGLAPQPTWTSEYPLPVDLGKEGDGAQFFGFGLGPAGDVDKDGVDDFLIGAWHATHGDFNEGAAFLYLGSTNTIAQVPAWRGFAFPNRMAVLLRSLTTLCTDGVRNLRVKGADTNQRAVQASPAGEAGGPEAAAGNGLRNMRARAEAVGRKLVLEPAVPRGTRLSVLVPLD